MLRCFALLAAFALTRASNTLSSLDQTENAMEMEKQQIQDHRSLTILEAIPCPVNALPITYFNITFDIAVQNNINSKKCDIKVKGDIGDAINAFLLEYGVGNSGTGDNIMFISEVCSLPGEGSKGSRRLSKRVIQRTRPHFRWSGGGASKFCSDENQRRQLLNIDPKRSWFNTVFKPYMETALQASFTNTVTSKFPQCFGKLPVVTLKVAEVKTNPEISC